MSLKNIVVAWFQTITLSKSGNFMKYFLLVAFLMPSIVFAASPSKNCEETINYDLGFNHGKNGKDLATPDFDECNAKDRAKLAASYRKGFKEALTLDPKAAAPVQHPPIQVVVDTEGDTGYLATLSKCSDFKKETKSCFTAYEGDLRGLCEVCREGKSCFSSLNGKSRGLCEAYFEKKSCFIALNGAIDRAWCDRLQVKKSCENAFSLGSTLTTERGRCERGEIPRDHYFWIN
jgi:hypothetical protein